MLLAGLLLVTGASAGAFLRRSGHAMRRAASVRPAPAAAAAPEPASIDNVVPLPVATADRRRRGVPGRRRDPPPLIMEARHVDEPEPDADEQASLFDVTEGDEDTVYTLPDRGILRRSKRRPRARPSAARTSPERSSRRSPTSASTRP